MLSLGQHVSSFSSRSSGQTKGIGRSRHGEPDARTHAFHHRPIRIVSNACASGAKAIGQSTLGSTHRRRPHLNHSGKLLDRQPHPHRPYANPRPSGPAPRRTRLPGGIRESRGLRSRSAKRNLSGRAVGEVMLTNYIDRQRERIHALPGISQVNGRTRASLRFGPAQSGFVVFRDQPGANRPTPLPFAERMPLQQIDGGWILSFDHAWGTKETLKLDQLASWSDHSDAHAHDRSKAHAGHCRGRRQTHRHCLRAASCATRSSLRPPSLQ